VPFECRGHNNLADPKLPRACVLIAVLIALMTIGFQSIKAALANPVKTLRTE